MKKIILFALAFVLLAILSWCSSSPSYSNLDEFAQCLTDKWVVLYGTTTCPYCQKQKELFGDSFKKINFVDCKLSPMKCNLAWIWNIPHWFVSSSTGLTWLQPLEILSKETWCELIPKD